MDTPSSQVERLPEARLSAPRVRLVLGLALGLRLLVLWSALAQHPPQWFFMRGMEMGLLAKSLLAGQGLGSPFGPPTGPTAFIAPVYPILVAGVFKLFGADSVASETVILLAQIALNLLTIWLMMQVSFRLFGQRVATIAGLVWACSLPLLWMPTIFWETSLSTCLLVGLVALALRDAEADARRPGMWVVLGAYGGVAALVNPALLLSVVCVAGWVIYQKRKTAGWRPLLSALVFVVVFSPWPIRNARAFHAFIPLRTTVGFELWMGNHAGATGFLDESLFPTFNAAELGDYKRMGEVAYTNHKAELARTYMAAHPGEFVRLTVLRKFRFWTGRGSQNGSALFAVHAITTTLLGFAGLWFLVKARRRAIAILFALPLAVFPLPYLITHAEFRYRLVIDPLLTILAAYAIAQWQQRKDVPA